MIRALTLIITLMALIATAGPGEQKTNIALLTLEGNNISKPDLAALENRLRTELFKTQKFTVVIGYR